MKVGSDEVTFGYDGDGNMTITQRKSSRTPYPLALSPISYTYNAFGHLIKVEKDGNTVVYKYNPLGQRINRTVTDEDGTKTEKYYYVGSNLLDIQTNDGTEKVISGLGIDEIYGVVTEDGSKHFFASDYLGSVKLEMDENGNIIKQRHYRAFGYEPAGSDDGFGFTSREYDSVAELYFYRSRYYDSRLGRFVKPDTFNETGLLSGNPEVIYNPMQLNDYVYVGNMPTVYGDADGYWYSQFNESGGQHYTIKQTEEYLSRIVEVSKNTSIFNLVGGGADYDIISKMPLATFDVKNVGTLTGEQFGNYLAGYLSVYKYGIMGLAGALLGGDLYQTFKILSRIKKFQFPHSLWDFIDQPEDKWMIIIGAYQAYTKTDCSE